MRNTTYYSPIIILLLGHLIFSVSHNDSSYYSSYTVSNATGGGGGDVNGARGMDHGAMDALKKEISGAGNLKNWELGDYCQWEGIACDDQLRVKSIDLSSRYLTGVVPYDALNSLTNLDTLFLQNNQFYGLFPCLSNLSFLKEINVSHNSFTKVADGTFANLTSLRNLSISNNPDLSPWNFPRDLVNSTSLLTLFLDNANINGLIPDFLASLRSLQSLNLSHNNFTGTVPNALSSLPSLAYIDISNNSLSGTMPVFRSGVHVLYAGNNFVIGTSSEEEKRNKVVEVLIVVAAIVGLVGLSIIVYLAMKRYWCSKQKRSQESEGNVSIQLQCQCRLPRIFSYRVLKEATNNFSLDMKLGKGGSCEVFKGLLKDSGKLVAVKKLNVSSSKVGAENFEAEVISLGSTRHCNVVEMVGYCIEEPHRMIVYEFMERGSLDKWIFETDSMRRRPLTWEEKHKIIKQIADGLNYLHSGLYNQKILHRDIKPQNVLLDGDFNAKLSDFGLAKILSDDETSTISECGGTFGYMAPEVFRGGKKSEKSDVYSYGVVVLEILFGEKIHSLRLQAQVSSKSLFNLAIEKVQAIQLQEGMTIEGMEKTVRLALQCMHWNQANRPSIATVLDVLEGKQIDIIHGWLDVVEEEYSAQQ